MKAFPNGIITNKDGLIVGGQQGMDLRDWFAGMAMQSFIHEFAQYVLLDGDEEFEYPQMVSMSYQVAEDAYFMAERMMQQRKKHENHEQV